MAKYNLFIESSTKVKNYNSTVIECQVLMSCSRTACALAARKERLSHRTAPREITTLKGGMVGVRCSALLGLDDTTPFLFIRFN